MQEINEQPGIYRITCTIETGGWISDPTHEAEAAEYLQGALKDNDAGEVEITIEYDPGATKEYIAETRAEALEDHWKGVDE